MLPEYTRHGEYEIGIKQAVAGKTGSFFIMAWTDTNNDGKPDKEIGRPDLKTASKDGDWSSWKFKSKYDRIFVENTCSSADEKVFYQNGGSVEGYLSLFKSVFYARAFNGKPNESASPRFTNMKVKKLR